MFNPTTEFDYEICDGKIKPIAEALVRKYPELKHVDPDRILFVVNHKNKDKKRITLAKTTKLSAQWTQLLYQITDRCYFFKIEFLENQTACMDTAQIVALVYRELCRITPEGDLTSPDVNDWWQILQGLGRKWFYPDNTCPNLLDENVTWETLKVC